MARPHASLLAALVLALAASSGPGCGEGASPPSTTKHDGGAPADALDATPTADAHDAAAPTDAHDDAMPADAGDAAAQADAGDAAAQADAHDAAAQADAGDAAAQVDAGDAAAQADAGDAAAQADAGDAAAQADAGDAAVQADAGACAFDPSLPCDKEFDSCTTVGTATAECGGLDCVLTPFIAPNDLMCLRPCACTDACQFGTFCEPPQAADFTTALFARLAGYCFTSYCGAENDSTSWYGNGLLLGACTLGGESYLVPGSADARPGYCAPIDAGRPMGRCVEAGAAPRGGTCTFDNTICKERATYLGCAAGHECVGYYGSPTGTCAKVCDPGAAGFDPAVPGSCAADADVTHDQYCRDESWYYLDSSSTPVVTYFGFCDDPRGCDTLVPGACAGAPTGAACYPTTDVDSHGFCIAAVGTSTTTCTTQSNCVAGSYCNVPPAGGQGTCEPFCGLGTNDGVQPCASGTCTPVVWIPPDTTTLNWGTCQSP